MATLVHFTRDDLAGFDAESVDLIMEAQDEGWFGRMSSRSHVIMRAPDGTTTMSVSRRWSNGRSGPNMRANFERWRREQARNEVLGEVVDQVQREQLREGVLKSMSAGSAKDDLHETMAVVYKNVLDDDKVMDRVWQMAKENRLGDFGFVADYPTDDSLVRPWTVCWAVFDRRDMTLIGFGGASKTPDGDPYDEAAAYLLIAAQRAVAEEKAIEAEVEKRPYICTVCGRTFKHPQNLGRHTTSAHKPEPVVAEVEPEIVVVPVIEPVDAVLVGEGEDAANAMVAALDHLSTVATRMAFLEGERAGYEARLAEIHQQYAEDIERLTKERDNAVGSLTALKALIAEIN